MQRVGRWFIAWMVLALLLVATLGWVLIAR